MIGRAVWFASFFVALLPGMAEAESDLTETLTRLGDLLEQKNPDVASSLRVPLTSAQIAALESEFDVVLPDAVKVLYQWHDGQNTEAFATFVNNLQFKPLKTALEEKVDLDGMIGYDFTLANYWHPQWLPIFDNGAGDLLVVDMAGAHTGQVNQLVMFYHDWEYRPIVASDLATFMQGAAAYYEATPVEAMDEFHDIDGFLPDLDQSFSASGSVSPSE